MFFIEMEAGLMKVVLSLVNVCRPLLTIYSDRLWSCCVQALLFWSFHLPFSVIYFHYY